MAHIYSRTLQKASNIDIAMYGSVISGKAHGIVPARYAFAFISLHYVLCRGEIVERPCPDKHGRIQSSCFGEVFEIIRSIAVFRLVGAVRDCIIVGTDSDRIKILDFDVEANSFPPSALGSPPSLRRNTSCMSNYVLRVTRSIWS